MVNTAIAADCVSARYSVPDDRTIDGCQVVVAAMRGVWIVCGCHDDGDNPVVAELSEEAEQVCQPRRKANTSLSVLEHLRDLGE